MLRVAVIGCGYVGLVTGACLAELGHQVICVDVDDAKISCLQKGEITIHEAYLPELVSRHLGRNLCFTTELKVAVSVSSAIVIAVGTPQRDDNEVDLSQVEKVARQLGTMIKEDYKVIIEKSTVPVLTSNWISKVMELGGASPHLFDVAANPEFLREGTAVADFLSPERIILGADSPKAMSVLHSIYAPLINATYYRRPGSISISPSYHVPPPIIETNTRSAELIKYACNCFLALKVSYVNAMANLCESVGADIDQLCAGMASDSRIGARFLSPGLGFGGSGFAKDISALVGMAEKSGCDFRLLNEVTRINDEQLSRFMQKIKKTLWTLKGKKLAILGLSYKGGTDDIRESPALKVVKLLLTEGCRLVAYDPAAMGRVANELRNSNLTFADSPYAAADGCQAAVILTDWNEFTSLNLDTLRERLSHPIVIDGRNLYTPELMSSNCLMYTSVGRRVLTAEFRTSQSK